MNSSIQRNIRQCNSMDSSKQYNSRTAHDELSSLMRQSMYAFLLESASVNKGGFVHNRPPWILIRCILD